MFSLVRALFIAALLFATTASAADSDLTSVKAEVGKGINKLNIVDGATTFAVGDKVYALFLITNPGSPKAGKIVWKHGETVRAELDITIGTSKTGWKTYGQHKMGRKAVGSWTVHVESEDGAPIASTSFTVQ